MKNFLAVYLGSAAAFEKSGWATMDEPTRKARERAGMEAWGAWMKEHAGAIIVEGGPLGRTKRASPAGVDDVKNNMSGYVIVQAESHAAAAQLFANHPHFKIFPGDSIEIMECLPIPGR